MKDSMAASPEEESLLLAAIGRAFKASPFWTERLGKLGLAERDFVPGFPFAQLPLLEKGELLADQQEQPPFGRLLAAPSEQVRRVHKTSGTSGKPFLIALTDRDIADTLTAARRSLQAAGMGPRDRVVHCLNFNMWSGGVTDYLGIEATGATGIPFGVGNTSLLLSLIQQLGVNAISCTPSYMYALRDRIRDELGIDPKCLGLRRGYFGGEGVLQVPGVRDEIESIFGMRAIDANYGMSEVLSIIAGEEIDASDELVPGLTYHAYGILHAELVDVEGRTISPETGATGELIFSLLRREAQPLFRYRTRDLVKILWADKGEDGLLRMRFSVIGRSDEMLVFRGVNFFPQSLVSVLMTFEPNVTRYFEVIRPEEKNFDSIRVRIESALPEGAQRDELERTIGQKIAALHQIRVTIEWIPAGTISRDTNKRRLLVDR